MKRYLIVFMLFWVGSLYAQTHYFRNSTRAFDTTVTMNKHKFFIHTNDVNNEDILFQVSCESKTILSDTLDSGGLFYIQLIDFNKDGYSDVMFEYSGNNDTQLLYLFNSTDNTFRTVVNFEEYPSAMQLKANPKYYYSYHRAGCSDENWVSDLFSIENFKAVQFGHIEGKGCDGDTIRWPQAIFIYRIIGDDEAKEKLVAKLPYLKNIPTFGDKWDFIKKYWNKNYQKFL